MTEPNWTLSEIAGICRGRVDGPSDLVAGRLEIDSRKNLEGALFVALRGERFDGHDFIENAVAQGARAVLVDQFVERLAIPQVVVGDTLEALQRLGAERRRLFTGRVFGITGSAGKTTTRNILAAILEQTGPVHKPIKNFNNHIGVPLTLMELSDDYRNAVVELGCSDFGEIDLLTALSRPDVGIITNVGPAHLEKLGDLDGVARAKGELFAGLRPGALAVVNLDDPRVAAMPVSAERVVTFGQAAEADVRLVERSFDGGRNVLEYETEDGRHRAGLSLLGQHNAQNALAAIAAAHGSGIPAPAIAAGLSGVRPEPGRLVAMPGIGGTDLLDDTYNANPLSTRMALDTAAEIGGASRVIAILGDMLELGDAGPDAHYQVGSYAAKLGIGQLIAVGPLSTHMARGALDSGMDPEMCVLLDSTDKVAKVVLGAPRTRRVILVKGSRGMKMERVVEQLAASGE